LTALGSRTECSSSGKKALSNIHANHREIVSLQSESDGNPEQIKKSAIAKKNIVLALMVSSFALVAAWSWWYLSVYLTMANNSEKNNCNVNKRVRPALFAVSFTRRA